MKQAYIVTGDLIDGQTVRLDESVPLTRARVRVIVELPGENGERPYESVVMEIREAQARRGYVAPGRDVVDEYLQSERKCR
jgi:hypothetical protein